MATDYSTRIAGHFLAERAQLGAALSSLSSLADESLATLPAAADLRSLQEHLQRPLVFVAVGEATAGKSSLLHALAGREFSDADGRHTSIFKYGEHPSDRALTSSLVERCRPLPFLRDFELVDTAAASAILGDQHARIEDLAPTADLILFAVSVSDPWNENAWNLVQGVYEKHGKEIVIAVTHADERPAREVEAICRHLERRSSARLGREFPVFPVSARQALLARTSGLDRPRLWRESGFARLEARIDEIVGGRSGRGADLPAAAVAGSAILRDIAGGVLRLARDVEAERSAIAQAQATIDAMEDACLDLIAGLRERLQEAAARGSRQGANLLRVRVAQRAWPALFGRSTGRRWGRAFHRNLAAFLKSAFDREIEGALNAMIVHFQTAADRILACDQPSEPMGADQYGRAAQAISARCRQLAEEVELTLVEHLAQDSVESRARALLDQSSSGFLCAVATAATGLLTAVGACAAHLPGMALATAAAGGLAAAPCAVRARRQRREALRFYQEATPAFHATLVAAVDESFRSTASACCEQLRLALEPLSVHCARRADHVRPMWEQVEGLESVFGRIDQGSGTRS